MPFFRRRRKDDIIKEEPMSRASRCICGLKIVALMSFVAMIVLAALIPNLVKDNSSSGVIPGVDHTQEIQTAEDM
ncbi:hypothetical protein DM01DRAFT_302749 [Hesseltinella vesiculosa]|uniref:Uncharacterized protein n=1 Tax=Hesseltinella vesiculosa TaxID=101127 RepID=A0A1X2GQ44_9FUNG|nr:hypothetical protein DM01DRAFT_302749 [Hesseltinella vesiculosa]